MQKAPQNKNLKLQAKKIKSFEEDFKEEDYPVDTCTKSTKKIKSFEEDFKEEDYPV